MEDVGGGMFNKGTGLYVVHCGRWWCGGGVVVSGEVVVVLFCSLSCIHDELFSCASQQHESEIEDSDVLGHEKRREKNVPL